LKEADMQVAKPVSQQGAEASVGGGAHVARLRDIDEPSAQAAPYVAQLAEDE
jgi:hypothetical protein